MERRKDSKGRLIFGEWSGNPKGYPEDPSRCIEGVYGDRSMIESQCKKKRGHGPDGCYCKQHANKLVRMEKIRKEVDAMIWKGPNHD